jgi:L-asparaginase II
VIGEARVLVHRGAGIESEHRVAWATTDSDGARARRAGMASAAYPGPRIFARSASKPFQALRGVRAGVLERFGLGSEHLALACASHGGSDDHVRRVREILHAAGRDESDLACGASEPRDPAAARFLQEAGGKAAPVRHNCSGKHAFGVAFAVAEGWSVEGYLDAAHPLQEAMERGMTEATRVEPGELARAVDGCGMQTFSVPIARLAAAFGRLASGGLGAAGEQLAAAMTDHPELVAYDGALDTEMMRAHPRLVSKIGAEGVMGLGLPDGRGAALKVLDGAPRALHLVAPLLVEEYWGVELAGPGVERLRNAPVVNSRGEPVGRTEARLAA